MKNFLFLPLFLLVFMACSNPEEETYTNNFVEYPLMQATEQFNYSGKVIIKELMTGEVEIKIQLDGNTSDQPYFFPAHLHFGDYQSSDAPIAYLLNPVNILNLESTTVLNKMSDGRELSWEEFKNLDAHIKIHLAADGPDYQVILVAGDIGSNYDPSVSFDAGTITTCSPYFGDN